MQALLALNRSGALASNRTGGYSGFRVNGRLVPGLASQIKAFKLGGDTTQPLRLFAPGPKSGLRVLSGKTAGGITVHKLVADSMQQSTVPRSTGYALTCARAAWLFAQKAKLRHEASELVISHSTLPLATRFDALFRRTDDSTLELVSWKSGSGPRHAADVRRHKAQLALEWKMLRCTHRVQVRRAKLVYLGAQQCIRTGAMRAVYSAFCLSQREANALATAVETKLQAKRKRRAAKKKARK
jgi:hypothetical protein